jgi:hypothetical protein
METKETTVQVEAESEVVVKSEPDELVTLTKELLAKRVDLALAKRRKRVLLEELHRQCLESEVDPKKRMKAGYDKIKKCRAKLANGSFASSVHEEKGRPKGVHEERGRPKGVHDTSP